MNASERSPRQTTFTPLLGRHHWDLAVYYRGSFDPADLRAIGWAGEVFEIGGWGGGVFNGGAWLTIDDRKVDVLYRDLDVVEHELAQARQGRFHWEPLMFHLAGIPAIWWLPNSRSTRCCGVGCRARIIPRRCARQPRRFGATARP